MEVAFEWDYAQRMDYAMQMFFIWRRETRVDVFQNVSENYKIDSTDTYYEQRVNVATLIKIFAD